MITYILTARGLDGRWFDILDASTQQPITYTSLTQAADEAQQTADCLQTAIKIVKITRSALGTYDPQEQQP